MKPAGLPLSYPLDYLHPGDLLSGSKPPMFIMGVTVTVHPEIMGDMLPSYK